ncbi:MAG TPA: hypothetical protein VM901_02690 [Bdellovibrionota bacterium]|nr:hypothetical protein [Bdellovibrionota bacterium]
MSFVGLPARAQVQADEPRQLRQLFERAPLNTQWGIFEDVMYSFSRRPELLDDPQLREAYDAWTHRSVAWITTAGPLKATLESQVQAFFEKSKWKSPEGDVQAKITATKAEFETFVRGAEFRQNLSQSLPAEFRQDELVDQLVQAALATAQKEWSNEVSTPHIVANYALGDDKWDRRRKQSHAASTPRSMDKWQRRQYASDTRTTYQSYEMPKDAVEIVRMVTTESTNALASALSVRKALANQAMAAARASGPVLRPRASDDEKSAYYRSLARRIDEPKVAEIFARLPAADFYKYAVQPVLDPKIFHLVESGKIKSFPTVESLGDGVLGARDDQFFLKIFSMASDGDKVRLAAKATPVGTVPHYVQKEIFDKVHTEPKTQKELLAFAETFFSKPMRSKTDLRFLPEITPFADVFSKSFKTLDEKGWKRLEKLTEGQGQFARAGLYMGVLNQFKTAQEMLEFLEKSPAWSSVFKEYVNQRHFAVAVDTFSALNPTSEERAKFRSVVLNDPSAKVGFWKRLGASLRMEKADPQERAGVCRILTWALMGK